MADRTKTLLAGLDAPRALPHPMRSRLALAVAANLAEPAERNLPLILDRPKRLPASMRLRLVAALSAGREADIAQMFEGLDDPRPLPEELQARLRDRIVGRRRFGEGFWQTVGAGAAAVVVLAGTFLAVAQREPGRESLPPAVVAPPTHQTQPDTPPADTPSPPPTTRVLGRKITTPKTKGTPGGSEQTTVGAPFEPAPAPSGADDDLGFAARPRTRAASSAPAGDGLLAVLSPVLDLVRDLLGAGTLDVLSLGRDSATVAPAGQTPVAGPAPDTSATTKPQATRPRSARKPQKPSTAPAPAATPKPLVGLPLLGGSEGSILTVEVAPLGLTLSL